MSKAHIDWVVISQAEPFIRSFRRMRNSLGLATPIGHVVPPRGTFRRAYAEFLVALRRAFD